MSEASTPMQTQRGYSPPTVTQFSVFLTNKVGKLFDLVEAFDGFTCQICALSVHEASDHAVVRIITSDAGAAAELLKKENLPYSEREVLVVEIAGHHTLASLCLCLLAAELSIHFAYPLMMRTCGTPTIALAVDDMMLAGQILRRKEFNLLGEADLPGKM
ncbi:MAG: acetolactate synthase [Planctomycetes bacterium]|nr:acetolactate synthase [Planctomycetota bacterium]